MFLFIVSAIAVDYCTNTYSYITLTSVGFFVECDDYYHVNYHEASYRRFIYESEDIFIRMTDTDPLNLKFVLQTIIPKTTTNAIFIDYQNTTEIDKYAANAKNSLNLMILVADKCIWDSESYLDYKSNYQISKHWKKECLFIIGGVKTLLFYDHNNDNASIHYIKKGAFIGIIFAIIISILLIVISTYLIGLHRYRKVNKEKSESCNSYA